MKQMRLLFGQQQDEVKRTIEHAIAQHIQPLNSAIAQERTERTQVISSIKNEIAELRAVFDIHHQLHEIIYESLSSSLHELGSIVIRATKVGRTTFQGSKRRKRPYQSYDIPETGSTR